MLMGPMFLYCRCGLAQAFAISRKNCRHCILHKAVGYILQSIEHTCRAFSRERCEIVYMICYTHSIDYTAISIREYEIAPGGKPASEWEKLFPEHADRISIGCDTWVNFNGSITKRLSPLTEIGWLNSPTEWPDRLPLKTQSDCLTKGCCTLPAGIYCRVAKRTCRHYR